MEDMSKVFMAGLSMYTNLKTARMVPSKNRQTCKI
jgi:hypothetical protein